MASTSPHGAFVKIGEKMLSLGLKQTLNEGEAWTEGQPHTPSSWVPLIKAQGTQA